ncbi:hypothetical protein K470DRAFT_265582 [Piedraia hortae CBS 480.64]|uniref:Uncharacterized protein n=1 Tax=Piedraia hortae CBS 480.64 TaxID=1314780 RepID=A0A6A7BWG4_9PEZI|nr:hypothetical protein K470DRAFT_265582 [Piedraia hortae CBS 480.64]
MIEQWERYRNASERMRVAWEQAGNAEPTLTEAAALQCMADAPMTFPWPAGEDDDAVMHDADMQSIHSEGNNSVSLDDGEFDECDEGDWEDIGSKDDDVTELSDYETGSPISIPPRNPHFTEPTNPWHPLDSPRDALLFAFFHSQRYSMSEEMIKAILLLCTRFIQLPGKAKIPSLKKLKKYRTRISHTECGTQRE